MGTEFDFDAVVREVLSDRDSRTAYMENRLRRGLAGSLDEARRQQGLSVRALAKAMHTSVSEVQRLLHEEVGGSLTLRTVCRAADALGMKVALHIRDGHCQGGNVLAFGGVAWGDVPEDNLTDEDRATA